MDFETHLTAERRAVVEHPLYHALKTEGDVRVFMEHHVWAVWDFMSLLSMLHNVLARSPVPWRPPVAAPTLQRFLHEILCAETADVDPRGGHTSHWRLYLDAMEQVGANTRPMEKFAGLLSGQPLVAVPQYAAECGAPGASVAFVTHTMHLLANGNLLDIAAAFAFSRERIIPAMFANVRLPRRRDMNVDLLATYLARHVEVDDAEHGPMARALVVALCRSQTDEQRALHAARAALTARLNLWNGTLAAIERARQVAT